MPNEVEQSVSPESLACKHEVTDRYVRNVLIIAGAAAFLIFLGIVISAAAMFDFAQSRQMQHMQPLGIILAPNLKPFGRFPKPNLDTDDEHSERMQLYGAETAELNSYGWINRSNGIVHIPIDRAMDLILQQNLPEAKNLQNESPLQLIQKIPEQQ